jgi:predicted nucleotidyltransferase
MADALFTGTKQRVLAILYGQPDRSFYANEVISLVRGGSGAVQRELARFVQSELVTVRKTGNQKHYQANSRAPIFAELCALTQKTVGLADPIRSALAPLESRISAAFVFGSVARRQDAASSDIDLMVISDDVGYPEIYGLVEDLSRSLGRQVSPTIYTSRELATRITRGDAFIKRVLAQARIWIIGGDDALGL